MGVKLLKTKQTYILFYNLLSYDHLSGIQEVYEQLAFPINNKSGIKIELAVNSCGK